MEKVSQFYNVYTQGFTMYVEHAQQSLMPVFDAASGSSKLLQVANYSLYGCVQSMEKVRLLHSKRDTLLLSFNDAKVKISSVYSVCVCVHHFSFLSSVLPRSSLLLSLILRPTD